MSIANETKLVMQNGGGHCHTKHKRAKGKHTKHKGTKHKRTRRGGSPLVPLGLLGALLAMGPKHHRRSKKRTRRRRRGRR